MAHRVSAQDLLVLLLLYEYYSDAYLIKKLSFSRHVFMKEVFVRNKIKKNVENFWQIEFSQINMFSTAFVSIFVG